MKKCNYPSCMNEGICQRSDNCEEDLGPDEEHYPEEEVDLHDYHQDDFESQFEIED